MIFHIQILTARPYQIQLVVILKTLYADIEQTVVLVTTGLLKMVQAMT